MKGQKTGGRQKGTPNKKGSLIKEAAQKHGPAALKTLVDLMKNGESQKIKLDASKEILDRAYGRPTQTVEGPGDDGAFDIVHTIKLVAATSDDKPAG